MLWDGLTEKIKDDGHHDGRDKTGNRWVKGWEKPLGEKDGADNRENDACCVRANKHYDQCRIESLGDEKDGLCRS